VKKDDQAPGWKCAAGTARWPQLIEISAS